MFQRCRNRAGPSRRGGNESWALWDQLGPFLGGRESGTGRLSTLATQPQLPTPSTPARTTGLSEPSGQELVLCGPCVQFVKSYLKRDYNPATDTPTESMDMGAGRAHLGLPGLIGTGENGGESCGSFRIQRQVQGKAPDESRRSF